MKNSPKKNLACDFKSSQEQYTCCNTCICHCPCTQGITKLRMFKHHCKTKSDSDLNLILKTNFSSGFVIRSNGLSCSLSPLRTKVIFTSCITMPFSQAFIAWMIIDLIRVDLITKPFLCIVCFHLSSRTGRRAVEFKWTILKWTISIHLFQFELVWVSEGLALFHSFFSSKHLTNLYKRLIFSFRNNKVHVDGHCQTHGTEHQIAVGPSRHL